MLQAGDVLRTWRLSEPPTPDHSVDAESIGNHRLMYLDYEGEVSGGRGKVKRIAGGTFDWIVDSTNRIEISMDRGRLVIAENKLDFQAG
jgi:hypothetical protein